MTTENEENPHVKSVVAWTEVPLEGPIYFNEAGEDDLNAHLTIEVRDFGKINKTLVIRTWLDGQPITTMVSWDKFTDAFDTMRAGMMSGDWDDALALLVGSTTEQGGVA
jgi:hypothetical protein